MELKKQRQESKSIINQRQTNKQSNKDKDVWTRRRQKEAIKGGEESYENVGRRRYGAQEAKTGRAEEAQGSGSSRQGRETYWGGRHQEIWQEVKEEEEEEGDEEDEATERWTSF